MFSRPMHQPFGGIADDLLAIGLLLRISDPGRVRVVLMRPRPLPAKHRIGGDERHKQALFEQRGYDARN